MKNYQPIDDVDATILKEMLRDPRTKFTKMAKKCGLSSPAIKSRFHNLEKSGLINGSITQINPKSYGYNCVAITRIKTHHLSNKEVHELITETPFTIRLPNITGNNIIVGFLVTKNTDELAQIVNELKSHPKIISVNADIWVEMKGMDLPENLVIDPKNEQLDFHKQVRQKKRDKFANSIRESKDKKTFLIEPFKLDKIDTEIIKLLLNDARISFRKIAIRLKISPNNVITRYRELKKTVILSSSITLNLEKIGYMGMAFIRIKVSKGKIDDAFQKLRNTQNIIVCVKIVGQVDIIALAPFRTFEELNNLKEYISNIKNIFEVRIRIEKAYDKWPVNTISELILKNIKNPE